VSTTDVPNRDPREQPDADENSEQEWLDSGIPGPGGEGMIHPTPSQAEGDRETIENDLAMRHGSGEQGANPRYASDAGVGPDDVTYTPSQAEGDRETIDRDLEEKGM
jgi:hypothetical protein